jgi:hypothetical protein
VASRTDKPFHDQVAVRTRSQNSSATTYEAERCKQPRAKHMSAKLGTLSAIGLGRWLPVVGRAGVGLKDRLDGLIEELRQAKGERQAGIVFASLNGVHGLARNSEPVGQFRLGPFTLGAKYAKPILHWVLNQ